MDDLFRLLWKIINFIFIVLLIDMLFSRKRRRGGPNQNNGNNKQSRYFDDETRDQGFDQSQSHTDFYQGESLINQAYQALGLQKGTPLKDVKKRYIELAKKYHPDKNPGNLEAQAEMTKINNAYDIIVEDFNKKKA
ncbi:DnaJ domain-containing protein [Spiroplasma endosymbiont of Cantharis lateralis]|uniref:DnaJ domain-containing protein n=1 Tax=Spiroplasma endosymbiont of Cantharis lateralis TaxID=3066277 RepID=UPI00313DC8EC